MLSSIVATSIVAFIIIHPATAVYTLDPSDNYSGANFFNLWDFKTASQLAISEGLLIVSKDNDPTGGFVDYQSQAAASSKALIGYNSDKNRVYIGVDSSTVYSTVQTPSNRGRASVRIESKKQYTKGMFIADIFHMPEQACGVWPSFWTVSHNNYPQWGEIDILENINEQTTTLNTLHTSPGCVIAGDQGATRMTGSVTSYNCDDQATSSPYGSQSQYQGCSSVNTNSAYGKAFNAQGGGIVVMEWSTHFIKMWNFAPSEVPANIKSGSPDTASWPTPAFTTEGGSCVMDDHFQLHNIVFDTTFCGTYAGQDYFWQQTSCYKSNPTIYATCAAYVAANPAAFTNAYWIINSVKVYKWQD